MIPRVIRPPDAPETVPTARPRGPRPVFLVPWTTGPDPALDGVLRLQALRPGPLEGQWERFDVHCASRPEDEGAGASARTAREFGVTRAHLAGAPAPERAWGALLEFAGPGPLVVPDTAVFAAWHAHLARGKPPACAGLSEVAALCLPGRLSLRRESLVPLLAPGAHPQAFGPQDLRTALLELARRVHGLPEDVLRVLAASNTRAWRALAAVDPDAAARLGLCLALLDTPSAWSASDTLDFGGLEDGRISRFARDDADFESLLEGLKPACARETERWADVPNLPPAREEELPFHADDLRIVDDVFQVHLPALFGAGGAPGPYRASQHSVAREVAGTFGARELLLVHAPTGTGKTLAYLVPAMLWARRHGVRVGIATYTRTLQEQALDREVPRALNALARAGIDPGTRVGLLKGRENYLCWRALKQTVPEDDRAEAWLAWTQLALFALTDVDGDLDRLPRRPPLELLSSEPYLRAFEGNLRAVRAQTACCSHRTDRAACAAELARKRAERSHVVLVNQAFVLARPEFFRHVVFDECEHLHDQAHNAWSRTLTFRELHGLLARLRQPGRSGSRALLDRIERQFVAGTPSMEHLECCVWSFEDFAERLGALESAARAFEAWREEERKHRPEQEQHFLLREYVERVGADLVAARVAAWTAGNELDAALGALAEHCADLPLRGAGALRRGLDLARTDLATALGTIGHWMPLEEDRPRFDPSYFYDIERDARGDLVLAARVLLPHEVLGSRYYPELAGAVFLSATTWLRGGFDAARCYLGLDRAASPGPDEARPPSTVRTFRAPDVFDWSRALVAVPTDSPAVKDKRAFLAYVRRFVAHLAERTRGRMLVLFTNALDMKQVGQELVGFFRARRIPFWFQNQDGTVKEELSEMFRARVDSVLLGVDTFWYGADFPGETLEYVVIVKLPYGVPDRYHQAQCAAIGADEQRRRIYMPRALAKFRQGFGRLMRRETDRGCVFLLDGRAGEPRHRAFLRELPIAGAQDPDAWIAPDAPVAKLVRGDTQSCMHAALAHMGLLSEVERRGLGTAFGDDARGPRAAADAWAEGDPS